MLEETERRRVVRRMRGRRRRRKSKRRRRSRRRRGKGGEGWGAGDEEEEVEMLREGLAGGHSLPKKGSYSEKNIRQIKR